MLPLEETPPRRIVSVPNLTAWLSLCILAAAWGRSLDDRWQPVWASMGAYGLVASVGLSALEKARRAHQKRLQDRAVRSRVECGLDRLHEQGATLDSVNAALRRLNSYVSRHPSTVSDKAGHPKRASQAQSLASLPLEIAPVVDNGEDDCELASAIDGSIEKISSAGVSFLHAEPFVARVALLTFRLGEKQRLSFVVDVLWTEVTGAGFMTGGTVLAVGVPDDPVETVATHREPAEVCSA